MNYMLCRNRVRNFDQWKRVFDSHAGAHGAAGLKLVHLWHEVDNPCHVFFLFEVEDIERARAFLNSSDVTASEHESGLIEGDFRFFGESLGYGPSDKVDSSASAKATGSVVPSQNSSPAETVKRSVPTEPAKSPEPEKSSTLSESVKTTELAKISTPPATMKGPERVMSAPPPAPVDGWEPVENWPPAEAAAQSDEPAQHRPRWARTKY